MTISVQEIQKKLIEYDNGKWLGSLAEISQNTEGPQIEIKGEVFKGNIVCILNDKKKCKYKFVNFDSLLANKLSKWGYEAHKAPDMLDFSGDELIFTEFKDGLIKNIKDSEIKLKAFEGAYIGLFILLKEVLGFNKLTAEDYSKIKKKYFLVGTFIENSYNDSNRKVKSRYRGKSKSFGLNRVCVPLFLHSDHYSLDTWINHFDKKTFLRIS